MTEPDPAENEGGRSGHSLGDLLFLSRTDIGAEGIFAIVLALAAMAVVFLGLAGSSQAAAILLALLLIALALITIPAPLDRPGASLGRNRETRLLALVTIGILGLDHCLDPVAWITMILLAGVVIGETALSRLHSYTVNSVANLPGYPWNPGRIPAAWINPATLVALVACAIAAVFCLSWVPALLIAAVIGVVALADLIDRLHRLLVVQRRPGALRQAITDYRPTFALYWKADPGTDYQVSMWLPYLERIGLPFVVIVRTQANFEEATALTTRPVLLRRAMADLDALVVPSLKTVFYVNNAAANSQMVRYPGLTHIMLNHGDSDKAPSYNPVSRMYDKNFVAGQAAIDRFTSHGVTITESQFSIVGRPQIEDVEKADTPIAEVASPRVLYAPTWAGFTADAAYSSLPWGVELVRALLARGCTVVFRPHPYAYRSAQLSAACAEIVALLKADPDREHVYGEPAEKTWSLSDCFNHSDAMISDVSGVVADYLYSGKPLAMTAVHAARAKFAAEFPLAAVSYLLEATPGGITDLDATLDRMLGDDPLAAERRSLRSYYLGDPGGRPYADLFFDEVRKYV